jgi:hypothetical protein
MKPEFKLARSLPGHSQIERVRAARAILNGRSGSEAMALYAFMAIFHPDYPPQKVTRMVNDVRERNAR